MYQYIKRFFDILASTIGLILIFPFMIPIVVLLRLTGEGEVFYLQERLGYQFKTFNIIKFATMLKNSLNIGSKTITLRNDPRITPMGKFLRMSKINELPQIWNVLKGDMSLVGPRPLAVGSYAKYSSDVKELIYKNRPGITGIGSLIFRDEEKLTTKVKKLGADPMDYYRGYIYPYKGQVEIWYQENISFLTDLKILFLTAWLIIFSKSNLVHSFFPSLPEKPESLTIDGIKKLYKTTL